MLWLDSDVCIQQDISGIMDIPGDVCIRHGGRIFTSAMGCPVHPKIDNLPTNNTGVVLVRDSLPNYNDLCDQCYHYTQHFSKTLVLPDQAILNYVLWRNNIQMTDLGTDYNYTAFHAFHSYSKAKLFHLACAFKFWNHSVLRNLFPVWEQCYKEWLAMGGSAFSGELKYRDIGPTMSILDVLGIMEHADRALIGQKIIIQQQEEAIAKLNVHLDELVGILKTRSA